MEYTKSLPAQIEAHVVCTLPPSLAYNAQVILILAWPGRTVSPQLSAGRPDSANAGSASVSFPYKLAYQSQYLTPTSSSVVKGAFDNLTRRVRR